MDYLGNVLKAFLDLALKNLSKVVSFVLKILSKNESYIQDKIVCNILEKIIWSSKRMQIGKILR